MVLRSGVVYVYDEISTIQRRADEHKIFKRILFISSKKSGLQREPRPEREDMRHRIIILGVISFIKFYHAAACVIYHIDVSIGV